MYRWKCSYCRRYNSSEVLECVGCGAGVFEGDPVVDTRPEWGPLVQHSHSTAVMSMNEARKLVLDYDDTVPDEFVDDYGYRYKVDKDKGWMVEFDT